MGDVADSEALGTAMTQKCILTTDILKIHENTDDFDTQINLVDAGGKYGETYGIAALPRKIVVSVRASMWPDWDVVAKNLKEKFGYEITCSIGMQDRKLDFDILET